MGRGPSPRTGAGSAAPPARSHSSQDSNIWLDLCSSLFPLMCTGSRNPAPLNALIMAPGCISGWQGGVGREQVPRPAELTAPSLNPQQGTQGKSPHSSVQPLGTSAWRWFLETVSCFDSKSQVSHPFEFVTMRNEEAECASTRAGSRPLGAAW